MKTIILLIIKSVAVITSNITFLWAVIEFTLFLIKNKDFNWLSVWCFIISVIIAFTSHIFSYFIKYKSHNK